MSASIKIDIHFSQGDRTHRLIRRGKQPKHSRTTRLPRITRLMALAIKYEQLLADGVVKNHKELAVLAGVERSHISTILRFRLLSPMIQEWLLDLPESEKGKDPVGLMDLRTISKISSWDKQEQLLTQILLKKQSDFSFPG